MKKLIILLSAVVVILIGGALYLHFSLPESEIRLAKAQDNIEEYIKKNANDPDSYESVEWGRLDTVNAQRFTMYHKFRAKNALGGLMLTESTFVLDKDLRVVGQE